MKRLFWMTALLLAIPVLARADCADSLWVCKLKQYEPNPSIRNTDNTSPECEGPAARGDVKKIKDAYDTLPDTLSRFKSDLCQVKHIFITSATPHNWGRYNDPSVHPNDNPGASYIAISRSDLNKNFVVKQNEHLKKLAPKGSTGILYSGVGSNSKNVKFGLLYSLAHELAHIKWHQQYPLTGNQPGIPCYDNIFGPSWQSTADAKMNRWTEFGRDNLGVHPGIPSPKNATLNQLNRLYNSGFVTALAAANPEEDFVESYAIGVVNATCVGCLFSINSNLGRTALINRPLVDAKIACVAQNYF